MLTMAEHFHLMYRSVGRVALHGCPPQHSRRLLPFAQHLGHLLPSLPAKFNLHGVIALHAPTMQAHSPSKITYCRTFVTLPET